MSVVEDMYMTLTRQEIKGGIGMNDTLKNEADYFGSIIQELQEQNKLYRNLLESIRYTKDIAKEIQKENPNIKIITPDDLLQHILRKVNKELEQSHE